MKQIHDGAIGKVVAAQCYWNQSQLWAKPRKEGWSDLEWMHRDWVNWAWLSGDHIVEQHVHNIDVINWAIGKHPISVVAMGGRARRPTGDQFDFFSSDFTYPDEVHVHSMCRQMNKCKNNVSERVIGTKGWSDCRGNISNVGRVKFEENDPYTQEHADLQKAIRTGERINEAQNVAQSTLCAIMARISAYTGEEVTWDDMMRSDLVLGPPGYELTEENIKAHIPVPGAKWNM
jgi:predicted dehydrogenase